MVHSCVLFESGFVWCWGDNSLGQLGIGSAGNWFSSLQRVSALSVRALSLSVGCYHSCILTVSDAVFCFGYNHVGQACFQFTSLYYSKLTSYQVSRHAINSSIVLSAVHITDVERPKLCSVGMVRLHSPSTPPVTSLDFSHAGSLVLLVGQ